MIIKLEPPKSWAFSSDDQAALDQLNAAFESARKKAPEEMALIERWVAACMKTIDESKSGA